MIMVAVVSVLVIATGLIVGRYFALLDSREERAFRRWQFAEQAKAQRAADVVAIAEKADTVEAALLKHEERISQLEMAVAVPRRRP